MKWNIRHQRRKWNNNKAIIDGHVCEIMKMAAKRNNHQYGIIIASGQKKIMNNNENNEK